MVALLRFNLKQEIFDHERVAWSGLLMTVSVELCRCSKSTFFDNFATLKMVTMDGRCA